MTNEGMPVLNADNGVLSVRLENGQVYNGRVIPD